MTGVGIRLSDSPTKLKFRFMFRLMLNILCRLQWRLLKVCLVTTGTMKSLSMLQTKQKFATTYYRRIVPCQIRR